MATIRSKSYFMVLVALFWVAYIAAAEIGWMNAANIFSTAGAALSFGILAVTSRRSAEYPHTSQMYRFGSYACFAWAVGDAIWLLESWADQSMPENPLMLLLYVLTNVFLLIAILSFVGKQLGKWNRVQMIADAVTILLLCTQFFWLFLFDKNTRLLMAWVNSDYTSILSVVMDIAILVSLLTWKLAIRNGRTPLYFHIFAGSTVLFALIDLFYYAVESKGLYNPNALIDIAYSATLALLAISALIWMRSESAPDEMALVTNVGKRKASLYLIIFPFLILVFHFFNLIRVSLTWSDFGLCVALLLLHWAISKYIQLAIENDQLWKMEKKHREMLEQTVAEQQEKLAFLANKDPLTLLSNRNSFCAEVDLALAAEESKARTILLGINIDRLKSINEAYGHDVGDKVVLALSKRLRDWNAYCSAIARISGDEFGILLPPGSTIKDAEQASEQILQLCEKPFVIDEVPIKLTLSIGIVQRQDSLENGQTLLENIDIAIRQTKSQGYHTYQVYQPAFSVLRVKSRMEHMLRQANLEKEFSLYYQPQVELSTRRIIGAEALLRWNNAEIGFIPPGVFIPIAEEIGLINEIGAFVLRKAMRQAICWNRGRTEPLKIGINISPKQIGSETFLADLREMIQLEQVDTAWIDLELTESTLVGQSRSVLALFSTLKEMGITVSIDDFGAGFSAIGYLNQFRFDRIKIDKSLVDNVSYSNPSGVRILRSIIEMSKAVSATVLAEGVEGKDQTLLLLEIGCDQAQGYLFGRPVPPAEFEQLFLVTI